MTLPLIPLTRWRGAKLYLNLPIPSEIRVHFRTSNGKPMTHIVEALGTGDPTIGRRLARERQAHWELEFAKVRRGSAGELPSTIRRARELRKELAEAHNKDDQIAVEILEDKASELAEQINEEAGLQAAQQVYRLATSPDKLTLTEALAKMSAEELRAKAIALQPGPFKTNLLETLK